MTITHLTDDLFNEYLDNALMQSQKNVIEDHLRICADCSRQLNDRRALFSQIESLPEVKLAGDFSKAVVAAANGRITFAPLLWLVFTAQAVVAFVVVGSLVTPLIQQTVDATIILTQNIETLAVEWANWISATHSVLEQTLRTVTQPLPLEAPLLMIALFVTALSLLWITGNGLLITSLARRRA